MIRLFLTMYTFTNSLSSVCIDTQVLSTTIAVRSMMEKPPTGYIHNGQANPNSICRIISLPTRPGFGPRRAAP